MESAPSQFGIAGRSRAVTTTPARARRVLHCCYQTREYTGETYPLAVCRNRLLKTIPNFIHTGPGAVVIQLSTRGATCANRSNRFISELDDNPTAKEHDVGELRKWSNRVLSLGALSQSEGVIFERDAGVGFIMRAIERVYAGAITSHRNDGRAVGIEHDGCFSVALLPADRDR